VIVSDRTRVRTAKRKETETVKSLGRIATTVKLTTICMLLVGLSLLFFGAPTASAAGPELTVQISHSPATFHRGELAPIKGSDVVGDFYSIEVVNMGDSATVGPVTVTDTLPEGLKLAVEPPSGPNCAGDGVPGHFRGASVLTCEKLDPIGPGEPFTIKVPLSVYDPADSVVNHVAVSGGGAPEVSAQDVTPVADGVPYSVKEFISNTTDQGGSDYTAAGGHPFQNFTRFSMPVSDAAFPVEELKDASVDLINGFLGNPAAAPRCDVSKIPQSEFLVGSVCPVGSRVGTANISDAGQFPLYNVKPGRGYPAEFAFNASQGIIVSLLVIPRARTESYGLTLGSANTGRLSVKAFSTVFNGTVSGSGAPFLSNPVDCSESDPAWKVTIDSWENPGQLLPSGRFDPSDPNWKTGEFPAPPVTACDNPALAAQFRPTLDVKPAQGGGPVQADQPTGLEVGLDLPQSNDPTDPLYISGAKKYDPETPQAPELKDITTRLPAGLAISPSSATGLGACSDLASDPAGDQVHYDTTQSVTCPESAKIGTVTATTPLLASHDPVTDAVTGAEPIPGEIYLLKPHPGDLSPNGDQDGTFRLLLQLDDPRYGLNFKLPGVAVADKNTGQLTATFTENPQLPVKHLQVNLKSGPRAPLATPVTCGTFTTTSDLTPWSAPQTPDATPSSSFAVGTGPDGSACASSPGARPFSPGLSAGTVSAAAGTASPFVLKLSRGDGEQEITSLNLTTPKGFTAKLAGIPYCSEAAIASTSGKSGAAEQASPSCPAASKVGTVTVGAGPGSDPFYTQGTAYLAGPYKGAPLSFVFITPAVAGPFDLGDVVVRAAVFVDPETTQVTVKTDPIPQMLDGVPLRIRSLVTQIDRSDFTLNPTNCAPQTINATLGGSSGATASPSTAFQVAGCDKLAFKPKLNISLKGSTTHTGHPALKAVVTYPQQGAYANIARAQVNLPHSEFLDQGSLNKTCTKPVLLEGKCPAKTIYGKAKAWTPLLAAPLEGPVYLVGGYGFKLPALVAELNGQIRVVLKGKVDSGPNKGIRNTFEAVPDAPVSRFVLEMKGGKKYGLLENSEDLCAKPQRAIARFTAQNGMVDQTKPLIANQCGKHKAKAGHKKHRKGHGAGHHTSKAHKH
jgi:hypothetical protein